MSTSIPRPPRPAVRAPSARADGRACAPSISLALLLLVLLPASCARHPPDAGALPTRSTAALPEAPAVAGPVFPVTGGFLKIEICAENIVRVAFAHDPRFFTRATLATAPKRCAPTPFDVTDGPGRKTITTAALVTHVSLPAGTVSFHDTQAAPSAPPILAERPLGRSMTPAPSVAGEATTVHSVRQQWERDDDEAFYGLGQHQQDLLDLRDVDLDLRQYNTEIFVPFLVSSRGYGILWDNTSFTRFGDLADAVPLPGTAGLYARGGGGDSGGSAGGGSAGGGAGGSSAVLAGDVVTNGGTTDWSGTITAPTTGDYLFRAYSAGEIKLSVAGALVIDHWRQRWLPGEDIARVRLTAGQSVPVRLHWAMDGTTRIVRLLWKTPVADRSTSLWSKVADGVDYTFVYGRRPNGPNLDRVIAGYRTLTGQAPMMPRSAFGLWQSRERYRTQQESVDVVKGFRARGIPLDNIVQDWQYWNVKRWGSHAFDATRFPDPDGWLRALHGLNVRAMVSVWPKFYAGTPNFDALAAGGFLFAPNLAEKQKDFLGNVFTVYDAFDPDARRLYWSQIDRALRARGVDSWWMDATEPEMVDGPFASVAAQVAATERHMTPTRLGSGARMLNAFSLVNSQAVYEGARASAPRQRVFILTRNGFAGQQRYAAASWSGDVTSTWTALRKQIPAGLGFSISGIPYWTVDSGGFSVPYRFANDRPSAADTDEWRELATRWFEYATFLPLLRSHGQSPRREMWEYGGDKSPAYAAQLKFDRLRYRLLPYVYSLAGAVTHHAGTILRPLVMDFPGDARARSIVDQYLFGPALLVSPISRFGARSRAVYLPATDGGWYDFWTGVAVSSGATETPAPFDAIPVHVRAGSILPLGPDDLQFTGEKPANPITLLIYSGANGAFTLYEDDGDTTEYERGQFTTIALTWNDATRTLGIGARAGAFGGMLARRQFQVVIVSPGRAVPMPTRPVADLVVAYDGSARSIVVTAPPARRRADR